MQLKIQAIANIYLYLKFQFRQLLSEKAIFLTKISQAWPVVIHAYQHLNGLNFWIDIYPYIKFYQNWLKNDEVIIRESYFFD